MYEILKYSSLISLPLFSIIGFIILKNTPRFSLTKGTFSESILYIEKKGFKFLFQINFLIKSILDMGFAAYLINFHELSIESSIARYLIIQNILFASLAFFVEGRYTVIHKVLVYTVGIFWLLTQTLLAQKTGDALFILLTDISTVVVALLAYSALFSKKTNIVVQGTCIGIFYTWLLIYVLNFLN